MNSIILAVLAAVAGSIATELLHWPLKLWRYLKKQVISDHLPLYDGWARAPMPSGDSRLRVHVSCAPDRTLKRRSFDVGAAVAFVHHRFPGAFPEEPKFANVSSGVRFEKIEDSVEVGYLWVWKSGRIDLQKCVDVEKGDDGSIVFDLNRVIEAILDLATAMNTAEYWRIYNPSPWHLLRRFDWYVSISTGIRRDDGGTVSWTDANFPGRRPMRAGGSVQAVCPQGGYARDQLRSWRPSAGPLSILNSFLNDFLLQNGFYDCEEAIHDIVIQPHIASILDSSIG